MKIERWILINLVFTCDSGEFCESGDSGQSVDSGESGDSGEYGGSIDSGKSGESGESGEFGESGDSGDSVECGDFVNIVSLVILMNLVTLVQASLIYGLFSKRKNYQQKNSRARIPRLLGPKMLYGNVVRQKWHILSFCWGKWHSFTYI